MKNYYVVVDNEGPWICADSYSPDDELILETTDLFEAERCLGRLCEAWDFNENGK